MFPSSFEVFGLTLHLYGLLIGLGAVLAYGLIERIARRHQVAQECVDWLALWVIILGVLGGRLWHVITDFHLYSADLLSALYIWQGGMSIVGAIAGGAVGVLIASRSKRCHETTLGRLADLLPFGVPIAQAVGRLGNWANQELYGLPTSLPWGLYVAPEQRPWGMWEIERYHPLFAYEALLLGLFAGAVWWHDKRHPERFGKGLYAAWYLLYYAVARFFLEFLRLDKLMLFDSGLSVNQVVMVGLGLGILVWLVKRRKA